VAAPVAAAAILPHKSIVAATAQAAVERLFS